MSGSVTIRYAIAATVKKVALNVADAPSLAVVKMSYSLSTSPRTTTSAVSLIRMTNSFISGGITRRTAWGTIA
jgi:hypothetical protein